MTAFHFTRQAEDTYRVHRRQTGHVLGYARRVGAGAWVGAFDLYGFGRADETVRAGTRHEVAAAVYAEWRRRFSPEEAE